jgi:hypothetical protein
MISLSTRTGATRLRPSRGEISTRNEAPATVPPAASISRMQASAVPPVGRTIAVSRRSFSPGYLARNSFWDLFRALKYNGL